MVIWNTHTFLKTSGALDLQFPPKNFHKFEQFSRLNSLFITPTVLKNLYSLSVNNINSSDIFKVRLMSRSYQGQGETHL